MRERIAALAVAVAPLLSACSPVTQSVREVDVGRLGPNQVLVLGRVHARWWGQDPHSDFLEPARLWRFLEPWLDTNRGDGLLIPESEEIAWVVDRPAEDVWLVQMAGADYRFALPVQPLLVPGGTHERIVYFGDVDIRVDRHAFKKERLGRFRVRVVVSDRAEEAFRAFVAENPALAGQRYFDVRRQSTEIAPAAR